MGDELTLATPAGLDERLQVLTYGDEVDAFAVRGERFTVLVDTLSTPELCAQALELIDSSRPLLVVNTHADWDHVWGNTAIAGRAPIIAHRAAIDRIRGLDARRTLQTKAREDARFRSVQLIEPTITFNRALTIDIGGLTLELIHTPGHTPDHLVAWIPQLRVCLAGDAVEDPVPELWDDTPHSLRRSRHSLRAIQALRARFVLPAHGHATAPLLVNRNLDYLAALSDRVDALPVDALLQVGPQTPGLGFDDLLGEHRVLSVRAEAFYRECHAKALGATLATRRLRHARLGRTDERSFP